MDNKLILPCDTSQVSDGYHTFEELYDHRCLLFMNFVLSHREVSFKTRLNDKREAWEGWFICGMDTRYGQITYHLPEKYWTLLSGVQEKEFNDNYDGHTSKDVAYRLFSLAVESSSRV